MLSPTTVESPLTGGITVSRQSIAGPIAVAGALAMLAQLFTVKPATAEPVTINHHNVQLNGELVRAGSERRPNEIILLVHGTLAHHRMQLIATMQRLLAERQLASLAITLSLGIDRRVGNYPCATPHRHKHTDALDEIGVWLAWLQSQGAQRVILMGHSRGANQVARFAVERPHPAVVTVVLLAPSTWTAQDAAHRYQARNKLDLDSARAEAAALAPDAWLNGIPFLMCGPSKVMSASFLSYYGADSRHDTPSLLPQIAKPTLVIAGSADDIVPDLPARTRRYLDGNTKLVIIDGADHFFRDFLAEEVADAVAKFLATRP